MRSSSTPSQRSKFIASGARRERNLLPYSTERANGVVNKAKVLIVDDDATASRLLAVGLEKTGAFQVKVENISTNAFATARAFVPDIILLDVCMPGVDGCDVAFQIQSDPFLRSIPIVFLTSLVSRNESRMLDGSDYLAKPTNLREVVTCIDRHLLRRAETANHNERAQQTDRTRGG